MDICGKSGLCNGLLIGFRVPETETTKTKHRNMQRSSTKTTKTKIDFQIRRKQRKTKKKTKCEGWDSNPRIPTKLGPQPSAFDLAGQPSHFVLICV